jgi:hypothetical protein
VEQLLEFFISQGPAWVLVLLAGWFFANRVWPVIERLLETIESSVVSIADTLERIAARNETRAAHIAEFLADVAIEARRADS